MSTPFLFALLVTGAAGVILGAVTVMLWRTVRGRTEAGATIPPLEPLPDSDLVVMSPDRMKDIFERARHIGRFEQASRVALVLKTFGHSTTRQERFLRKHPAIPSSQQWRSAIGPAIVDLVRPPDHPHRLDRFMDASVRCLLAKQLVPNQNLVAENLSSPDASSPLYDEVQHVAKALNGETIRIVDIPAHEGKPTFILSWRDAHPLCGIHHDTSLASPAVTLCALSLAPMLPPMQPLAWTKLLSATGHLVLSEQDPSWQPTWSILRRSVDDELQSDSKDEERRAVDDIKQAVNELDGWPSDIAIAQWLARTADLALRLTLVFSADLYAASEALHRLWTDAPLNRCIEQLAAFYLSPEYKRSRAILTGTIDGRPLETKQGETNGSRQ
ncbi:MAG: hypothetical protein J7M25_01755 [Deltaproteobacteria bacterium]|nr:hypothetical protein [Deltaproteobacteria bacterium]